MSLCWAFEDDPFEGKFSSPPDNPLAPSAGEMGMVSSGTGDEGLATPAFGAVRVDMADRDRDFVGRRTLMSMLKINSWDGLALRSLEGFWRN